MAPPESPRHAASGDRLRKETTRWKERSYKMRLSCARDDLVTSEPVSGGRDPGRLFVLGRDGPRGRRRRRLSHCALTKEAFVPSLCPLHLSRSLGARVSGLVEEGAGFRVNAARTHALAGFRTGAVCRSVCGEDPDYAPDFSNSKMQKQEGPHSKATSDVKAL